MKVLILAGGSGEYVEKTTSSDLMTSTEGDMNISKKWINNPKGYGDFV